jgi:hypothetical protein
VIDKGLLFTAVFAVCSSPGRRGSGNIDLLALNRPSNTM